MSTTEHTPTPWAVDEEGMLLKQGNIFNFVPIASPFVEGVYSGHPLAIANADFIVKAVNSHDDLTSRIAEQDAKIAKMREALEECEGYLDNRADADCDQDGFIPNEEMNLLSSVRAALADAPLNPSQGI